MKKLQELIIHFVDIQSSSGLLLIGKINSVSSHLEISVPFLSRYYSFNFGDSLSFADPVNCSIQFLSADKGISIFNIGVWSPRNFDSFSYRFTWKRSVWPCRAKN
jgi:hypothetical protein